MNVRWFSARNGRTAGTNSRVIMPTRGRPAMIVPMPRGTVEKSLTIF